MAYFVVESFNNGIDTRRSREVAPPGSLRVLRNAFINAGGEIEKRKAFVMNDDLTDYGQTANYKGKINGPHTVPGYPDRVFFQHRHNSLPGAPFTAGSGTLAERLVVGTGPNRGFAWVAKSAEALTNFGALMCANSYAEFATGGYIVSQFVETGTFNETYEHFEMTFTGDEPTTELKVTANNGRDFEIMLGNKSYVILRNTIYSSAVGDPSDMAGTGSGNFNIASNGRPVGKLISLGDYYGQLAAFGQRGVQFYSVSADPAATQYLRTIMASIYAQRSITSYAGGDILYLGRDGIRSLQARDSSNYAAVSDVGSPIDMLVASALEYDSDDIEPLFTSSSANNRANFHYYPLAKGIVDPGTGQFWLFLKGQIYVYSRHPASSVAAWSTFDLPTPDNANLSTRNGPIKSQWAADAAPIQQTVMFRNFADEVYLYGGDTGDEYDASECEVVIPYLDMGTPETTKYFTGVSMVCAGTWVVQAAATVDSNVDDYDWFSVATITSSTRSQVRIPMYCQGTQIAFRLVSTSSSAAKIGQFTVHYDAGEQK
jgi:hypothetical protein